MFTEYEVQTFLGFEKVKEEAESLRKDFIKNEAPYLEINTHDFFSLVLMTPAVGIANSNGNISLFEEIALNKMARKMSKGGFFMKSDPVARAMKFFIKSYDKWETPFLHGIQTCMNQTFDIDKVETTFIDKDPSFEGFPKELMVAPYVLVRYLTAFFLQGENEIMEYHSVARVEYEKVLDIGEKLGIDHLNIFKAFCATLKVK